MGFMDGIRDVLGGFNAVKQIDSDGFDWREKRAAAQAARDQEVQLYEQANEDYLTKSGAEAMVGGASEQDVAAGLPASLDPARRRAAISRMVGQSAQSKSALEGQKAYTAEALERLKGTNRLDVAGVRGETAKEIVRLREKIRSGQGLSPREQATLDAALQRTKLQQEGANYRDANGPAGGSGSRGRIVDYYDKDTGENVRRWVPQQELEGFNEEPPLPATMRQGAGMIEGVKANVDKMAELAEAGLTSGPIIGAASKKWQEWMGPSGDEGEFDFLGNAVVDTVYAKSGKQINAEEQRILGRMIPNRAKGNLTEQVRLFDEYINHLFAKYGGAAGGGRRGGGNPGGGRGGERMVKYKGQLVPLSSLPPELQARVPR